MSFPAPQHDHSGCTSALLRQAEKICAEKGARLTAQRRDVLACVAESHVAVGAYDVIERMAAHGPRPAPIAVYRALDFLQAHNLVHKIESRNAFVACAERHEGHPTALLICDRCGTVAEVVDPTAEDRLAAMAQAQGFTVNRAMVELSGTCGHCAGGH
jgi:Fur family transcriptional regulator, zinc uptake regulator